MRKARLIRTRSKEGVFNFYVFGVSLTLHIISVSNTIKIVGIASLLISSAWVLPVKENEHLEVEIKKCAIIRDDLDAEIQRRVIIREGIDAEMKKRAMIRDSAAKMVQGT